MKEIKSIADQLRSKLNQADTIVVPSAKPQPGKAPSIEPENNSPPELYEILAAMRAYDNTDHKSMVHVRFDAATAQTLSYFKMATGVDVNKFVAFSVKRLIDQHPELREIIKKFLQNLEL